MRQRGEGGSVGGGEGGREAIGVEVGRERDKSIRQCVIVLDSEEKKRKQKEREGRGVCCVVRSVSMWCIVVWCVMWYVRTSSNCLASLASDGHLHSRNFFAALE